MKLLKNIFQPIFMENGDEGSFNFLTAHKKNCRGPLAKIKEGSPDYSKIVVLKKKTGKGTEIIGISKGRARG